MVGSKTNSKCPSLIYRSLRESELEWTPIVLTKFESGDDQKSWQEGDSNPRGLPHENTNWFKQLSRLLESHAITTRPSCQITIAFGYLKTTYQGFYCIVEKLRRRPLVDLRDMRTRQSLLGISSAAARNRLACRSEQLSCIRKGATPDLGVSDVQLSE